MTHGRRQGNDFFSCRDSVSEDFRCVRRRTIFQRNPQIHLLSIRRLIEINVRRLRVCHCRDASVDTQRRGEVRRPLLKLASKTWILRFTLEQSVDWTAAVVEIQWPSGPGVSAEWAESEVLFGRSTLSSSRGTAWAASASSHARSISNCGSAGAGYIAASSSLCKSFLRSWVRSISRRSNVLTWSRSCWLIRNDLNKSWSASNCHIVP